jgi:ribosomal protein S18 acetylase RimI-like enzyme
VRPAVAEDAVGIARVRGQTWRAAYGHVFTREQLDTISEDEDARRWSRRLNEGRPRGGTIVAVRDDDVHGFASFGPEWGGEDADIGELYSIYVLPEASGLGIGQALMRETLARLRSEEFGSAVLWVLEDNPRTRRFYELAGWHADGETKEEDWLGAPVREVRYRIAL